MSRYGKAETLAIAAAVLFSVLFSVLFFAFVAYLGWAEATADTIILRDGSRSRRNHEHRIRGMRPLNHLTWSITDYRVRISSNLEKGAHVEQSEK